ncbi:phosphatidylserine decarboxylase [Flavobacteriales bacterium 33_180_T64]|nr:phosphatidylserine decarboxylase [Flavobacteriales bacterium 33_180_T64]
MKKHYSILLSFLIILLFSCKHDNKQEHSKYNSKTLELIDIVNSNPEIKSMLLASIEKAKQINPDIKTNPAQNLEDYYEFVSWSENAMPWQFLEVDYANTLYDKIDQSLCYFFFINDQPLEELEGKGYFNNSLQYHEPYKSWLTSFNKTYGDYMNTEVSWNSDYYQIALSDGIFGLQNDWYESPSNWKTFNQFFARHLKSPKERPITGLDNQNIVVSPADAQPQGVWAIDSTSVIVEKEGIAIKSGTLYDVKNLIGESSAYEDLFANGTFTHSFLDVGDYHRYHFPLSGTIKEIRIVQGESVSGGYTTWDSKNKRYKFDASSVGWQSIETRGCVILETEEYGLVALLPIGMWPVSSVNFEDNLHVGSEVSKGDMLGYFLFGGSDFITIFQEKAQFVLDAPKKEKKDTYQHQLMGEQLGTLGNNDE